MVKSPFLGQQKAPDPIDQGLRVEGSVLQVNYRLDLT